MSHRQELFEMGWNDVIGNLRRSTAPDVEKNTYALRLTAGAVRLPHSSKSYRAGTVAAANAFLRKERTPFKGPVGVVMLLEAQMPRDSLLPSDLP